jgi:two-component system NtrC family sensor kinase
LRGAFRAILLFGEPSVKCSDQERILDALFRVNRLIASVGDVNRLLEEIMREGREVARAEASSLMLYDEQENDLYFKVALGEKGEAVKTIRLKLGEGIAGSAARERRTIVVNDVSKDPRHFKVADEKSQFTTRNLIATPMVRGDNLVGVLEVLNKKENEDFDEQDVLTLEFFADQAAIAIENARLIEANIRAERLSAVGMAVTSLSHYIKNVLTGMMASTSLIGEALGRGDIATVSELWPIFQRSTHRINSLVRDMLTYSREVGIDRAPVSPVALVREVYELCKKRAEEASVALRLSHGEDIPETMLDEEKLHDALLNLVVNAIEACEGMEGAEVVLGCDYDAGRGRINFRVADNGPGVPEEIRRKIFEPFFTTKGGKGTGLGLAVVRKFVQEHGGQVIVESEPGKGARFTLELPFLAP